MTLTIVWHKPSWSSPSSPTGRAAFGGLPRQIDALSELFDATRIVGPRSAPGHRKGETAITGKNITVVSLAWLPRSNWLTWLVLPVWLLLNGPKLTREILRADAVFPLIPSPIGMLGLALALILRKPLLTRQLNNWSDPRRLWRLQRAVLERIAGGKNVVFATGGGSEPPSRRNHAVHWIFSTALFERDLDADAMPRQLGPSRCARLIIAGREVEIEGTLVVLRALPILAKDFPDVTLDVVGNGASLSRFRRLLRDVPLGDRVRFHGPVDSARVVEMLRRADVFCLAAVETEAFRQAVPDALAAGLPLVAVRSSIPPMFSETGCVMFVEEKTPEALAAAVRACLTDPERYRRMSTDALRTAKLYTLECWRDLIGSALEKAWGPLQSSGVRDVPPNDHAGVERARL